MLGKLKLRKSGGVRVSPLVYALIRRGNYERERRLWQQAADAYAAALDLDSGLAHIWIQLGHMRKEAGDIAPAAAAYIKAATLKPEDPAVLQWIYAIAGQVASDDRMQLVEALRATRYGIADFASRTSTPPASGEVVFDISDLVSYFTKARLPTGIQRVQIETIRALFLMPSQRAMRICCTIEGRDEWVEVPSLMFLHIAELSLASGDRTEKAWMSALNTLHMHLTLASAIHFGGRATLVNLGTSWWLQNYFLQVRNAKEQFGIRYVPFVHDMIPIQTPEHCVDGLVRDFVSWTLGVFAHADGFLVASKATESDLRQVAKTIGHRIAPDQIGHIPLNADVRTPAGEQGTDAHIIEKYGLKTGQFVLFVSTIESRKGHTVALDAWSLLMARANGTVPTLVCVGNPGWLNEGVYARIEQSPALTQNIKLLSRISDSDLTALYQHCRFTIYPSLYEGWGLPITESLCHGKAVITCNNSSLPEAGGAFATFVATGSVEELAAAVDRLANDDAELQRIEKTIAAQFAPRSWSQIGNDILTLCTGFDNGPANARPDIQPGLWYALTRSAAMTVWDGAASAEMYRVGTGWGVSDDRCAWIRSNQAEIRLPLSAKILTGPQISKLVLRIEARAAANFDLFLDGERVAAGTIAADEGLWLIVPFRAAVAQSLGITITVEPHVSQHNDALGVSGFGLLGSDLTGNARLLEAALLHQLDAMRAFRDPRVQIVNSHEMEASTK